MRLGFIVKLKSANDLDLTKKLNFYNILSSFPGDHFIVVSYNPNNNLYGIVPVASDKFKNSISVETSKGLKYTTYRHIEWVSEDWLISDKIFILQNPMQVTKNIRERCKQHRRDAYKKSQQKKALERHIQKELKEIRRQREVQNRTPVEIPHAVVWNLTHPVRGGLVSPR